MVSLKLSSLIALVMANTVFQNIDAASISSRDTTSKYPKQPRSSSGGNCIGFTQQFGSGTDMSQYWADQSDAPGTWDLTSNALELKVLKPKSGKTGPGSTFSSNFRMQYGSIEAKVKSAPVGGIVTAFIWMAPGGDEIDYEWVGTEAQSAYYYHAIPDYSTEGSQIVSDDSSAFHVYRIDWSAESMVWSIDGKAIRTVTKDSTLKNGTYHYPTEAANVQFGVWDASENPSTAAWAHGPVNWSLQKPSISAFIEYITVSC